ncbi:hypothetical protein GQ44DRAFT_772938 [Phaeosphaeriaceae sp. PMI808]|nr:hypothetical protein GQ44DRAFT_772938 [Phaeosphaeriaceae sp. PMI808]
MQDPTHLIISTPGAAAPLTLTIPQPNPPPPSPIAIITLPDGSVVTATAGTPGAATLSGTPFSANGPPLTLANGIVLSAAPNGVGVVMFNPSNGVASTIAFSAAPAAAAAAADTAVRNVVALQRTFAPEVLVTIGGRVYTATSAGGSVVIPELGVTVSAGGRGVVVDGTVVSDGGKGVGVVVGGVTAENESGSGSASVSRTGSGSRSENGVVTGGAVKPTSGGIRVEVGVGLWMGVLVGIGGVWVGI